jgi:hypothetical protein
MNRTKIIEASAVDIDGNGFYSVVAEAKDGQRFILGNYGHRDADRVARLAAKVQAGGSINADLWIDHYPRYGSEAYEFEAREASFYAEGIRFGSVTESDAPTNVRTLL